MSVVSKLSPRRPTGSSRGRLVIRAGMLAILLCASVVAAVADAPRMRGKAFMVLFVTVIAALVHWLTSKGSALSSSGNDPGDFSRPASAEQ
jgi:hypothetical protein